MNKQRNKKKRMYFKDLMLRGILIYVAVIFVFAVIYWNYIESSIDNQFAEQLTENKLQMQEQINRVSTEKDEKLKLQSIDGLMSWNQFCNLLLETPVIDGFLKESVEINSVYSDGCRSASVIVDKNNEIIASNRQKLIVSFKFSDAGDDNGLYICDNREINDPQIDKLYDEYNEMENNEKDNDYIRLSISSAYVNKKDHTFIPHEGKMYVETIDKKVSGNTIVKNEKNIEIAVDDEKYELIEFGVSTENRYPEYFLLTFCGEAGVGLESFNEFKGYPERESDGRIGGCRYVPSSGMIVMEEISPVYVNDQKCFLIMHYEIDMHDRRITGYYLKRTIIFAVVLLILTALICWRKSVLNKAKYAFEDYQRALTNNLAHDLKTPLTAISGYSENIQKMLENGNTEKISENIEHVIANVKYTDAIITRTLEFNKISSMKDIIKENISLRELTENALEVYKSQLKSKSIAVNVKTEGEISANKETMTTAVENLISNAVKFTPENGKIEITSDASSFAVINTADRRSDIKEIVMPFVKGDRSRNGMQGCGLGLSIVQNAAAVNGMKLDLESNEKSFKAVIRF